MKKSMRILGITAALVIALVTLTGCVSMKFDVELAEDGSGEVAYTMGYKKSAIESMGYSVDDLKEQNSFDEQQKELEEADYTVEEYEDEEIFGVIAKKHFDDIQEFSITEELGLETEGETKNIVFEKNGSKITYSQDTNLDLTSMLAEPTEDASQAAMMSTIVKSMEMTYKITLPFKAGENNATTVSEDGKTLEWKLNPGQTTEIKFVAESGNGSTTLCIIIGVCILLVIAVIIGAAVNSNKGHKEVKKEEPVDNKVDDSEEE